MTAIAGAAKPRGGWYYGWNIVAVSILSTATCNALTYNCYSLFLRDWSAQLHTSISHLQLALPTMLITSSALSPMAGLFADKYPARRLFACGLSFLAILYLAMSAITAPWQILLLYGLVAPVALTLSAAITANALISRWFVRHRGLALGLSAFGLGLAGVLLPPIIAALLPTVGWRMIWRGAGLLTGFIVMPLVVWVIRDRPTERQGLHYLSADGKTSPAHHAHAAGASQLSWRAVISRKTFWLLVAIYLPMMALYGGCGQNVGPYVANHGLSREYAGTLLSVMSLTHVGATLLLGMLSDRFGNRLPLAGLALVNAAGAALLAFGAGLPVMILGYAFVGSGGAVFTLLAAALAVEFGAEGIGRAFGVAMLFLPIGAFAPFAIARIQEITGSYAFALMGIATLVMMTAVLSLLLRERRRGGDVFDATIPVTRSSG
jgi:MFS family permease